MNGKIIVIAAISMACVAAAGANQFALRESGATMLAQPESAEPAPHRSRLAAQAARPLVPNADPRKFALYPVAGTFGKDLYIPYFVDLNPNLGAQHDFNCGKQTFDGHDGHDPYIRSFREQEIGVPIFAPRDALVTAVHDGEPDHVINSTGIPNYVTLKLDDGTDVQFNHLRIGIPVKQGDRISAGTQIGWVGSSGASTAPHLHIGIERADDSIAEAFAGPCNPGPSLFDHQPEITEEPTILGVSFSNDTYQAYRPAPYDDAPRTGTFVRGFQRIYFKTEIANMPSSTPFRITILPPNSSSGSTPITGTLRSSETSRLGSFWWGIDADLTTVGTWTLLFDIGGKRVLSTPFRVVGTAAELVNRPPSAITAAIEPTVVTPGSVPVCRVSSPAPADLDYDIVRYDYVWQVDGQTVRTITSAAQTDALAASFIRTGSRVSCSVTPSDGKTSGTTAQAFAGAPIPPRRRAVAR